VTAASERPAAYPRRVAVIGGGRWACVLAERLCSVVPGSVQVSVHTRRNRESVAAWMAAHALLERVDVSSHWPPSCADGAVIVANAARDHERAIDWALDAGFSVLVEKPMALSAAAAQRLADRAQGESKRLGAAHVFLFASYLERFAALVSHEADIRSLRVCWEDPTVESRYDHTKRFDPGLPVFADWLPHISSILGTLLPGARHSCEGLRLLRGGAQLDLELAVGSVPCSVSLQRNGARRRRIVEVVARDTTLQLDFSVEPGRISAGTTTFDGDPDWSSRETPLALMLRAFLLWAAGGQYDSRLDTATALRASRLIDQTFAKYDAALSRWLAGGLLSSGEADQDLRYALAEIVQCAGPLPLTVLEPRIERMRERLARVPESGWPAALINARAASAEEQS
jgi:predicted dehydrogenase